MTRALRLLTAAVLAGAPLAAGPGTALAAGTPDPKPAVLATRSTAEDKVAVVVGTRGAAPGAVPEKAPTATVTTADGTGPAQVSPVWSDDAAVALVVDGSGDGAQAFRAGQSGAAGLLLQLPPRSRSGVVADRKPPVLVAGPAVGAVDDVQALSELEPGGERDTTEALTLALDQIPVRPGDRSVIMLYTAAGDAGGEPAAALGERLREAGAVLAVVTTAPAAEYWTQVAEATGGLAVAAPTDRPIRAFDEVAEALRTRYVATFARPASGDVTLHWTANGATTTLPVTAPDPAPRPATAGAVDQATGRSGSPVLPLVAGLVVVVLLAVVAAVISIRRHPREPSPDDLVPAVPDGVRVFDMKPEAPKDITGSLFEPRAIRDARDAEARVAAEKAADDQKQAEEQEAREWAARRLGELQQRRREEAAAAAEREDGA